MSRETITKNAAAPMDFVRGDATGLSIPAHSEALRTGGEAFLTEAFQAFGALSPDNRITRITQFEKCSGGSTGQKLFLSVAYERPAPDLHTDLFVKFSRDFNNPVRDNRGKYEMESEVRFAAISRLPGFPISVPAAYFADYHHESNTGLLITQRVAFGTGGIEPHHQKCRDHELAEPVAYYRVIIKALARIAAAHKSGRLSPDIAARFPYDPVAAAAADPITHDEQRLHTLVAQYADFAARVPQLLPANITTPAFIAKLDREVVRFRQHEATVKRFLQSNPDLIALCHWNANIDNAWYWHDAAGALQCGLMDWGRVGQLNVAFALWGSLSGASFEMWNQHHEELIALFAGEFHAHGGPHLDVAELKLHLHLYIAIMGVSYFMESPYWILKRLPEVVGASGMLDPIFLKSESARNQLSMMTACLNLWQTHDFGASLDRVLARMPGGINPG
ncbi:MAG: hypothetical protein EPO08_09930 [Rhodospirillaceae bacterium]|nr:MAG: hypothetical protein EPO08_09930 [Rhodospirillaceae bacterium]